MDNDAVVRRVRGEFLESPGLCLTPAQAARLWGLDPAECRRIVDQLVACRFLRWTATGTLMRIEP